MLRLPWPRCKNRVQCALKRERKWYSTIVKPQDRPQDGRPLTVLPNIRPSNHRVEFAGPVPGEFMDRLRLVTDTRPRMGAWYRSRNKNRQWLYRNSDVTIYVFPKSQTCRILMGRAMSEVVLREKIERAFDTPLSPKWTERGYELLVEFSTEIIQHRAGEHRVFHTGPITPFRNEYYKNSLGLVLTADKSHPDYLETIETTPAWVGQLIRAVAEIANRSKTAAEPVWVKPLMRAMESILEQSDPSKVALAAVEAFVKGGLSEKIAASMAEEFCKQVGERLPNGFGVRVGEKIAESLKNALNEIFGQQNKGGSKEADRRMFS